MLDAGGLYIRVYPTGAKTWVFRYNFEGIPRRMTLGSYPAVSLAEARDKHTTAAADVKRGIDPGAVELAKKQKRKAEPTFSDMVDEFQEEELSKKKSGDQTLSLLKKDALPAWKNKKITDIKRRDIVLLLDKVAKRAPIGRNRLHGALTRLFNFAAERGVIEDSPCTRIKKITEKARKRTLDDSEIRALWGALDLEDRTVDVYRVTKLVIKAILLTGQRPGEVAGMDWAEIDQDAMQWRIPAERMKGGEDHAVPICPMTWAVIQEAMVYGDGTETGPVFRSSHNVEEGVTRHAVTRAVARHWSQIEGIQEKFTPHDLRRTMRTRLAELKADDIVAERLLGHRLQGMLAIYNQHPYTDEKRDIMMRWESRLQGIIRGAEDEKSNVIQLRGRR